MSRETMAEEAFRKALLERLERLGDAIEALTEVASELSEKMRDQNVPD